MLDIINEDMDPFDAARKWIAENEDTVAGCWSNHSRDRAPDSPGASSRRPLCPRAAALLYRLAMSSYCRNTVPA